MIGHPSRQEAAIKGDRRRADQVGGKAFVDKATGGDAKAYALGRRADQPQDGGGQRARVVHRHQQAGFFMDDEVAASRHVGCDQRPSERRGLEKAFRDALAGPGRQRGDMGPPPDGGNVGNVAEPGDSRLAAPAGDLDLRDAARVMGVWRAGQQKLAVDP